MISMTIAALQISRSILRTTPRFGGSVFREMSTSPICARSVASKLRIGYVPEHFSTPLHFATLKFGLDAELTPFPTGTGAMTAALRDRELDVAIGLTEGFVADLARSTPSAPAAMTAGELPYSLIGTYVQSPLRWAVSTGQASGLKDVAALRNKRVGVSRLGSGSYVMSFVLADRQGWLGGSNAPFDIAVVGDFAALRKAVNADDQNSADFFLWEHFTCKRFHDRGEIVRIGEIYTPWPSWMIAARDSTDRRLEDMAQKLNQGVQHFRANRQESVEHITSSMEYSEDDVKEWMSTVKFADDVRAVDMATIEETIEILQKAAVLNRDCKAAACIVSIRSSSQA